MKIILIKDDAKLGKSGTVKEVADSYATNVLIPKGIAVVATKDNLTKLQQKKEKEQRDYELKLAEAAEMSGKLSEMKELTITVKASAEGKLFGSVTNKDVADELNKKGFSVKKQDVSLSEPIRVVGNYFAVIKLFGGICVKITLCVKAQ